MPVRPRELLAALWVVVACGPVFFAATEPPRLLGETGIDAGRPYSPQYPLWSDGAVKRRWFALPPGSTIDASDPDAWIFPIGTKFWKEFSFGGRRVETRLLWKSGDGEWVFASYRWNDEQTEATLAPTAGLFDVVEIEPGAFHSIPGTADCRACHEGERVEVLGFNALQLSDDRDPLAPHAEPLSDDMVTLRRLLDEGLLTTGDPERWEQRPPRIAAETPVARAALGYLAANCGGCHGARGPLADLGLVLSHPVENDDPAEEPGRTSTIRVTGDWSIPGRGPDADVRVRPGEPDESTVLWRMASRRPSTQMPPLGTVLVDRDAVALIRRWIEDERAPGQP